MPKAADFKPTKRIHNEAVKWSVNIPAAYSGTGRLSRRFFDTKKQAEAFLESLTSQVENLGRSVSQLSAKQTADAANRSRDSDIEDIIGADGRFMPAFIAERMLKDAKQFREKLEAACAFKGSDAEKQFQEFLSIFQFQLGQRSLDDLRSYLEGEVLDHQFGVSDRAVFHQLKELIERHAIELHEPITRAHLDDIFLSAQRRFLLPQVFPVDSKHFVPVPTFNDSLLDLLAATDGDFVVVTGLPGSGKSTSLSEFFDGLETDERFETCRYLSFVSPNDDTGRLRLEAEALRVNLLSELHIRFRDLLDRRYDYCDRHLAEVLGDIGEALTAAGRKLVILIDGLDHAERDPLVRESLLRALPTSLPTGVVFVVGTQELKNWQPLALRKGREDRHLPIPLFTRPQTQVFLVEKHGLALAAQWIERIHNKSQGLPLYLRYAAVWLKDHGGDPATLDEMPEAGDGDIRNYYDLLWANFDRDGMSQARYLCGVLSALRFPVRLDELPEFQTAIAQADIAPSVRTIAHLLREEDDHVSVFHDSFRVFVNSKPDDSTRKVIARDILAKLKGERGSSRWFTHFYRYALEAEDEAYVLAEVNRAFVDFALQHCRPPQDVFGAIDAAAKAAVRRADLVTLARLGSLHCRTSERIEHQFDYSLLAKVQLSLGRVDDVLGFCCRHNGRGWLVEDHVAMEVMEWCAQTDNRAVGEKLFSIFRDTHQDKEWSDRHEIVALARVVAIYSQRHPAWFLRWLSSITFRPDTLVRPDTFAPGFAPHLSAFLDAYVRYRKTDEWKRLKRMHRLFPFRTPDISSIRVLPIKGVLLSGLTPFAPRSIPNDPRLLAKTVSARERAE